jgi:hypothetical protein
MDGFLSIALALAFLFVLPQIRPRQVRPRHPKNY